MGKLLYIEDDPMIAEDVRDWLASEGHHVEIADNGADGCQLLTNYQYDLVIIDWDLPQISGLDVCKRFRKAGGKTWIIFLTGKTGAANIAVGLDAGADDYLEKPFDIRVLAARVRSGLRRSNQSYQSDLAVSGLRLDIARRSIQVGEVAEQLTPREAALLEFFMRSPNKFFSARSIMNGVWPSESDSSDGTVRTVMRNLRLKLEKLGKPDFLKTVLGSGYILEERS